MLGPLCVEYATGEQPGMMLAADTVTRELQASRHTSSSAARIFQASYMMVPWLLPHITVGYAAADLAFTVAPSWTSDVSFRLQQAETLSS